MSDMRQLFDTAKGELPPAPFTVDEITEAGRRGVRRRRLTRAVSVAGAAAAVAVVAAVSLPLRHEHRPAPAAAVGGFTDTIAGFTVGDFRVSDTLEATPGYESAAVLRMQAGSTAVAGVLTVFRPGVFDPSAYESGTPVKVGGHSGYARVFETELPLTVPNTIDGRTIATRQAELPAVAWPYAKNAWATLVARQDGAAGMTADDVSTVAARVVPADGGPVATLPYRFSRLPAGWTLASVGRHPVTSTGDGEISRAYLLRKPVFTALTDRPELTKGILITVRPGTSAATCSEGPAGAICDLAIPHSDYQVEVADQSNTLSTGAVGQIVRSLTFADPDEPAGWFTPGK